MAEQTENNQIISYKTLRMLIGMIGIVLPVILPLGLAVLDIKPYFQDSISDYYATPMRDIFVGLLFVLGFFLLSYKGQNNDNIVANIGAVFAFGVALFPTTSTTEWVVIVHFVSAILLFAVFIYFAMVIFRRGVPKHQRTEMKNKRNQSYLVCGIIMIIAVVTAGLSFIFMTEAQRANTNIVFWAEVVALVTFGHTWLVKGGFFMADKEE